ncbi:hypothetical protein GW17_00017773 [Ensete ventricosum]|nr:hypothetical protein GW17_00017773 [Ensete ventricosum]
MRANVSSPCTGRRKRSPHKEKKHPREASARRPWAPQSLHEEKKHHFFSPRGEKKCCFLLLAIAKAYSPTKPRQGFFFPWAIDRDYRGKTAPDLQILPFLLHLLPSPLTNTTRQRAATVEPLSADRFQAITRRK